MPGKVRKHRLHIPCADEPDSPFLRRRRPDWLGDSEMYEVQQKQGPGNAPIVRAIYAEGGEWGEHQPLVDRLRRALFEDFPDVSRESIHPDPPARGPNREAKIFLKPNAQPKNSEACRCAVKGWGPGKGSHNSD